MKPRGYREDRQFGELSQPDPGYSVTTVTMCPMVKNKQKETFNYFGQVLVKFDRKIDTQSFDRVMVYIVP